MKGERMRKDDSFQHICVKQTKRKESAQRRELRGGRWGCFDPDESNTKKRKLSIIKESDDADD